MDFVTVEPKQIKKEVKNEKCRQKKTPCKNHYLENNC